LKDPWKHLREGLFGNVEPEITLEAVTCPVERDEYRDRINFLASFESVELLPAIAAGTSYGSREKIEKGPERGKRLNRKLIKLGHHTPLEAIQFNFHISGISKACGAQMSRHRIGQGHVSASRRFQEQKPRFVYPMLAYFTDQHAVGAIYAELEEVYQRAYSDYTGLRDDFHLKKEDARLIMPVSAATERSWWVNARALNSFFVLRLTPDAEWEIRRLANMILDLVAPLAPSLFADFQEKERRE
jgi:thymidylate synthase (FAD)